MYVISFYKITMLFKRRNKLSDYQRVSRVNKNNALWSICKSPSLNQPDNQHEIHHTFFICHALYKVLTPLLANSNVYIENKFVLRFICLQWSVV